MSEQSGRGTKRCQGCDRTISAEVKNQYHARMVGGPPDGKEAAYLWLCEPCADGLAQTFRGGA